MNFNREKGWEGRENKEDSGRVNGCKCNFFFKKAKMTF